MSVLEGDCIKIMKEMKEKSIDLINGEINTQNTKNNNTIPHCTISETEGIKN